MTGSQSKLTPVIRSFNRGLRCRNPLMLVFAVGLTAAVMLLVQWVVTSGAYTTVLAERLMLRSIHDDDIHVSYVTARLKRDPPDGTVVYVLGGSASNEMLASPDSLGAEISARCGMWVQVYTLAACAQTFGQSLAVIDNLPPGRGLVVIGVSPNRFAYDSKVDEQELEGRRYLMRSGALRRAITARSGTGPWAWTIIPGIMEYATTWARRFKRQLVRGDLPRTSYERLRYTKELVKTLTQKRELVRQAMRRGVPHFQLTFSGNAALLEEAVKLCQRKGFTPLLMEQPFNSAVIGHAWDGAVGVYRPFCRGLAAEYGITYIDPARRAGLVNADFADLQHLVDSGRNKWQPQMAQAIAAELSARSRP